MDDKGFIFTTDATLALVIFVVFTTSFITYQALPYYMGDDHQHLEALADSALAVMEQDGTLNTAAIYYAGNNTAGGNQILDSSLNSLLPSDVGYKITLGSNPSVINNRGLPYSNDVVTRVKVISGPQEGWVGRAWYKLEEVEFENKTQNVTTTLWNFHNWLTNFDPWDNNNHLSGYPYWGKGSSPQNISFSIPNNVNILGGTYLIGSANRANKGRPYGADVIINNLHNIVSNSSFIFLNYMPQQNNYPVYNYQGFINASRLNTGINNFYVNYLNTSTTQDMPWFALIGNYTTNIEVPRGLITTQTQFNNAAGIAVETAQDLDGNGQSNEYGRIYNLNTGTLTSFTNLRRVAWTDFLNKNNAYSDGVPFVITGVPNNNKGCAVSVVQDINIPPNSRIFDGFTVVNAYGAVDNALVEVWDGSRWNTVFCSFNVGGNSYSDRSDGYGNIPGIVYIKDYLKTGNNKVRVTVWDNVPGNDYDLVGLVNCYTTITTTQLPIKWENFPYKSYQSSSNTRTETRSFTVGADAQKALLFVGAGTDTRHIKVDYGNNTVLYDSDTIPYSLDISALDAAGPHIFTTGGTGNYTLKPGNYSLRVTITAASNSWESGDGASNPSTSANAELFSGTRIAILYPKFLENIWTTAYADNAQDAENRARVDLVNLLNQAGISPDPNLIRKEAMYAGDLPNAIPVRLELWRK
ncbi:MAG: hypothetical protein ACPK7O_04400 [Methanobacterium sp.]